MDEDIIEDHIKNFPKKVEKYKNKITMEAHGRKPHGNKKVCDFCGAKKPLTTILDPNKFPDNDWDKKEDHWDVCKGCKEFIQGSMGASMEMFMDLQIRKIKREYEEKDRLKRGVA